MNLKFVASLLACLATPVCAAPVNPIVQPGVNTRMLICGDYLGTAFVVGKNILATARHLTHDRSCSDYLTNKPVRVYMEEPKHDFALVTMDTEDLAPLRYSCKRYETGDMYNAYGYGHGQWSHTVMVATKNYTDQYFDVGTSFVPGMRLLLGDIISGMSGGPIFDKDWNVIGMNNVSGDNLAFSYELADTPLCRK